MPNIDVYLSGSVSHQWKVSRPHNEGDAGLPRDGREDSRLGDRPPEPLHIIHVPLNIVSLPVDNKNFCHEILHVW